MNVITTEKMPIKVWCEHPEEGALEQARHLANLPFLGGRVALMPDTHQGYGMPIGGVIATKGVVIPNAVGVDIGCGVMAVRTNHMEITTEKIKEIMSIIRRDIPVGFNHRKVGLEIPAVTDATSLPIVAREYKSAREQVGTLGGGNHFIEIQKGDDGYIWYMLHSGSSNLGKKVCDHYNKIAKDFNTKWYTSVPREWDLAFLLLDSTEGQCYMNEMNYCSEFSNLNREVMSAFISAAFREVNLPIIPDKCINVQHNFARLEHYKGQNFVIHRKGATPAYANHMGIIPGSQGTSSYIVKGLGNEDSWCSSSHGAGRKMGRKVACNTLILADEIKKLDDLGIIHSIRNKDDLDEASGAYKDIDVVMEEQKDLVEIVTKLSPLAVIKG